MTWKTPFLLLTLLTLACGGGGGGGGGKASSSQPPPEPPPGSPDVFLVKPYLQLGEDRTTPDRLALLWQAADGAGQWDVDWRPDASHKWTRAPAPGSVLVDIPGGPGPHRVWSARLAPLGAAQAFDYRVVQAGKRVFQQLGARALPQPGQPQRVAVVGDLADGQPECAQVAQQMLQQKVDYVVTSGDLAYPDGTVADYRQRFFPVLNADPGSPAQGSPVLRSTVMVGVLGNHDVGLGRLSGKQVPLNGTLAYYAYWDQPLNGPDMAAGGHTPLMTGPWAGFPASTGNRFPRMGSFSFDVGGVHWTVLDSNTYVDWTDPSLVQWVDQDLAAAATAQWRIVVYHHPSFFQWGRNLSWDSAHMRTLWPLFTKHHVDLVFTGHFHNYQRSRPVAFAPGTAGNQFKTDANVQVDMAYQGTALPRPQWPIHVLIGTGGAHGHRMSPVTRPYLARGISRISGFALLEVQPNTLEFKLVDVAGAVRDSFVIQR